ncbi:hypothetical protein HH1059_12890 [Halorhodospira halochloris]|uniref:Inner membrane protein n=1 Tax=Halorhodospira halochloris TaxID=1052 RepID=A0A0X8X9J5_HALHR|nr:M90 family metallopeptidase [Halorhodospira halochloris]MBK1652075.1 hypothetical protein [Halorhodospira halochloris]MCG5549023.1 zinc-dependent peptidase [Halorhodospira halochloris]BAU57997.1 hypothetical protein HH1059_12890 [Halorhodospira halochloris]
MGWIRNWRRRRVANSRRMPANSWPHAESALPGLRRLDWQLRQQIDEYAVVFLAEKNFEAVAGARPSEGQLGAIAIQAVLPVLRLGLDWYLPWKSVLLYPGGFVAAHEYQDEFGVVHVGQSPLIGEAWEKGPLILSLEDALDPEPGSCVVIHECAHKLDMLQGQVNGLPPLPYEMAVERWAESFSNAFKETARADAGWDDTGYNPDNPVDQPGDHLETNLWVTNSGTSQEQLPRAFDTFSSTDPGEFFAVASEAYFADPARLRSSFPKVFDQLHQLYGWQMPVGR